MLDLIVLIILPIATSVKCCNGEPEKASAILANCGTCRGGPCARTCAEWSVRLPRPSAEERQGPGETIGEMIDRIVGEVAREWVAETTVPGE